MTVYVVYKSGEYLSRSPNVNTGSYFSFDLLGAFMFSKENAAGEAASRFGGEVKPAYIFTGDDITNAICEAITEQCGTCTHLIEKIAQVLTGTLREAAATQREQQQSEEDPFEL